MLYHQIISWQPVLLVEETRVPVENHRPAASHCETLSDNVVSSITRLSGNRGLKLNISSSQHDILKNCKTVRKQTKNKLYLLKENVLPHTFKYKLPTPTYLYTPINIHDLRNFYIQCLFLNMILKDSN